jgi:hypothetical protein
MAAAVAALTIASMLSPRPAAAAPLIWEQWHPVAGVFDVGGPLSTGELVVAAGPHLLRLRRDGTESDLAPGYATSPLAPPAGSEAYIAVATSEVAGTTCPFPRDTVFAIRPASPGAIIRIDPSGAISTFVSLPDAGGLNGIAFDTVGRFGHRLLVTGGLSGAQTAVVAVDCHGSATTLTRTAPRIEGGLSVAPSAFARFGGDLIAPDELSGRVVAIDPSGSSSVIAESTVPSGPDIGVEGVGFVPPGFLQGGAAYTADRATPGNPHPGTDTLLRLPASAFADAGVRESDMLLITEGSDTIVDIRCAADCSARTLGMGAAVAHGEGHLLLVADRPAASSPPAPAVSSSRPTGLIVAVSIVAALGVVVLVALAALQRRRQAPPGAPALRP